MNILIIASDSRPLIGGVSEYTHQIARFLSLEGNKITVFSPQMDKDKEFDVTCPYRIYRYNAGALYAHNKLYRYFKEYSLVRNIIRKDKIQVIIGNHLCANPYIYWLVAKISKKPYCVLTYGMEIGAGPNDIDGFKKRLVLRNANKVFCISCFAQNRVIKLGIPPSKTVVVYPGIAIQDFRAWNKKVASPISQKLGLNNRKVIFTLGRLVERKGQDTVIKAMPKVLKDVRDALYLIAGEGPYKKELRHLTEEYRVKEQVIFLGRISESQKQFYYDACDIFVMVNREIKNGNAEGFGIVFLEANACGKPVIGGKSGGAAEAIIHNQTGLLVNPSDIDEVAEAITYLLKNPDAASRMGDKGRQMIEKKFAWGKLVPKIEQELRNLIS